MSIEVVLRETEDDFEVFSVAGNFGSGGSLELMHNLEAVLNRQHRRDARASYQGELLRNLEVGLINGRSNNQTLLNLSVYLLDNYPGTHWAIKVERWDGYVYWLRFDGPELAAEKTSRPVVSEPVVRISRYRRKPVL
jgi:hypothetical protein